jgi:hypothetical protein
MDKEEACGGVAQSVEQRTENPRVDGSIPPPATTSSQFTATPGNFLYLTVNYSHILEQFLPAGRAVPLPDCKK